MRRYLLLGLVVIVAVCVAAWQGLIVLRHRRDAELRRQRDTQWVATFQQATQAYGGGNYSEAERILLTILPNAEAWYPHDRRLADVLGMLGKSYRADHNYEQAEPILKQALHLYESVPLGQPADRRLVILQNRSRSWAG